MVISAAELVTVLVEVATALHSHNSFIDAVMLPVLGLKGTTFSIGRN